jgi:hypothetical protein
MALSALADEPEQAEGMRGLGVKAPEKLSCASCCVPLPASSGFSPGGRLVEDARQIEDHHPSGSAT